MEVGEVMSRLLIVAQEITELVQLNSRLTENGYTCSIIANDSDTIDNITAQRPELVMIAIDGSPTSIRVPELSRTVKQDLSLPVMALVDRDRLASINGNLDADDFVISPYDTKELELRIKRLLGQDNGIAENGELIKCDGLVIDLAKCEVTVDGRVVELTYREYELLKFLASNRGRVYSRDALLNKVWGYDYYGGDRTVDVHVRRLRIKIEESHAFIETVRNIGYRFIKDNSPALNT